MKMLVSGKDFLDYRQTVNKIALDHKSRKSSNYELEPSNASPDLKCSQGILGLGASSGYQLPTSSNQAGNKSKNDRIFI